MNIVEAILIDVPPITRILCIFSVVLTFLTYIDFVTPYALYFNIKLIWTKIQPWRIFTSLLYFGELNLNTCFKILLFYRFSRRLEEYSFRGNSINYLFYIIFGLVFLTISGTIANLYLLSEAFLTMILYIWSRRNQNAMLHIFGLIPLQAPYVTWFFVFLQLLIGDSIVSDFLGIIIGHLYYFLTDVLPKLPITKNIEVLNPPPSFFVKICKFLNLKEQNLNHIPENFDENDNPLGI